MKNLGYGQNYQYAHDFESAQATNMKCLPDKLKDRKYYIPSKHGWEKDKK